jgi:hypothetical protein
MAAQSFKGKFRAVVAALASSNPDDIAQAFDGSASHPELRFEEIVSILSEIDPGLSCLNFLLASELRNPRPAPNRLHHLLAEALSRDVVVITTNFDAMIEIALHQRFGTKADIYAKNLHKPHGSLQALSNGILVDLDRGQLKADIYSVAQGTTVDYSKTAADYLLPIVRDRELLIIGYSFSDSFDIVPMLARSQPKSALVVEYQPSGRAPEETPVFRSLPGFASVEAGWNAKGIPVNKMTGDPIYWIPPLAPTPQPLPATKNDYFDILSSDECDYLVARMIQCQGIFSGSTAFKEIADRCKGTEIARRASYFRARTLPEWDEVIAQEKNLVGSKIYDRIALDSIILLLDAASFLGPRSVVFRLAQEYRRVSAMTDTSVSTEVATLYRGKYMNCLAVYLINVGKPKQALLLLDESLRIRSEYGRPSDVFNASFWRILALSFMGERERAEEALESLRPYALDINDAFVRMNLSYAEGVFCLLDSRPVDAARLLSTARRYMNEGEDVEHYDCDVELFEICALLQIEGRSVRVQRQVKRLSKYVADRKFSFHSHVVNVLLCYAIGSPISGTGRNPFTDKVLSLAQLPLALGHP